MWRRRCCGSSPPPTPIARARSSTSTARAWRVSAELFGGATGPESIVHPLAIVGERFQSHLGARRVDMLRIVIRSEEHTSELQSLMRISYAVFCLQKNK